ncbi:MAG TPA: SDR family oxidoreductase [Ideonella sp.]|uniref:SDR family oxidoreductase n=1 Tax=Ideonella sp. TaxID=1929293 RepID=UPI002CAAAF51|nr:SDR family oxidoreductase [Ideonella sp.]HSI50112.1 SDR family oxidoreductase [Ideonella sp.]
MASPSSLAASPPAGVRPVSLVTGGARRIGREIALHLARHGHDLALHCRQWDDEADTTAAELRMLGARVAVLQAELGDEAECRALVPAAVAGLGRLDTVVNNASLFEYDDAASAGTEAMARHWAANTAAPVQLAQALAAHVSERAATDTAANGCVVNLLDQKLWNPNPDYFSYTLSKAALREATVLLAQALAPRVRVVGVAPGVTLASGPMTEAELAQASRMTPLQRSSSPADIARAVLFLIESPAITGTTLLVDGGQHLSAQSRDVLFLAQAQAAAAALPASSSQS